MIDVHVFQLYIIRTVSLNSTLMVFSSPTNDKLSFLVPESHAKAKNIALRNMLGCLLWAACCITCNTFINSCWAELHYHDTSCHPHNQGTKHLHCQYLRLFLPDLQARRRKAKANERAALEPTLAKPSTPLLAGRGLKKHSKTHRD